MKPKKHAIRSAIGIILLALPAPLLFGQQANANNNTNGTAPVYRLSVVERTIQAINYNSGMRPTTIGFSGTVLLPDARGQATVKPHLATTDIKARLEGLDQPQFFGRGYLTYVLWAITPDGRPYNIGELIPDAYHKAKIDTSTSLQTFALLVTAEPDYAVTRPSDLVVLQNKVLPDTTGNIVQVKADGRLLPLRWNYTWQAPATAAVKYTIPMHEYIAQTELYQAQNAINLANTANAGLLAPITLQRAKDQLANAQNLQNLGFDYRTVTGAARRATETAEDAQMIALRSHRQMQLRASNREQTRSDQLNTH